LFIVGCHGIRFVFIKAIFSERDGVTMDGVIGNVLIVAVVVVVVNILNDGFTNILRDKNSPQG